MLQIYVQMRDRLRLAAENRLIVYDERRGYGWTSSLIVRPVFEWTRPQRLIQT